MAHCRLVHRSQLVLHMQLAGWDKLLLVADAVEEMVDDVLLADCIQEKVNDNLQVTWMSYHPYSTVSVLECGIHEMQSNILRQQQVAVGAVLTVVAMAVSHEKWCLEMCFCQ
jgi:hypothetical protein